LKKIIRGRLSFFLSTFLRKLKTCFLSREKKMADALRDGSSSPPGTGDNTTTSASIEGMRQRKTNPKLEFDATIWEQKLAELDKECEGIAESKKRAQHSKVELLRMDMWYAFLQFEKDLIIRNFFAQRRGRGCCIFERIIPRNRRNPKKRIERLAHR
jgi:hypothetical protein